MNTGYLVRVIDGRRRMQVFHLRAPISPRWWRFQDGFAVIGVGLTDTLKTAERIGKRGEEQ